MIRIVIEHIIKLSNLSKMPPWPGRKLLEFFIFTHLLQKDSIKSPTNAEIIITIVNIKAFKIENISKNKLQNNDKINAKMMPEIKPNMVLLGLILGISFLFPKNEPNIYELVSKNIIINTKNINIFLS